MAAGQHATSGNDDSSCSSSGGAQRSHDWNSKLACSTIESLDVYILKQLELAV
jgi:hypothetical protein